MCLPPLSGCRDEQEGLAAVRRICEEYREAKGNIMKMSESTCTNTCTCLVLIICQCLKIKGRAAAVCPSGLFLQYFLGTHIIAHLQVYTLTQTQTRSFHAGLTISGMLLIHREEEEDTRGKAQRRIQWEISQANHERGGGEGDMEGGRGVEENMTNGQI